MTVGDGDSSEDSPSLAADLHRLFADDRLSIRPSPVAGRAVVAGARRARRRREIALVGGGSAVVALVLFAGVMLAALPQGGEGDSVASPHRTSVLRPGQQPSIVPPRSLTPGETAFTTAPGPDAERGELGPYGYGKLRLGMSFGDLQEGALLADPKAPPPNGCTSYSLAEGEHNIREIIVSEDRGLVMFTANRARTPEGIGVGSSLRDAKSTYKLVVEQGTQRDTIYYAKAGAGADYWLRPDNGKDGTVLSLRLVSVKHGC